MERTMTSISPHIVLDTRDLTCPLPVLQTRKAIDSLKQGQVLEVCAKGEAAKSDIIFLAQRLRLELVDVREDGDNITFCIKK
jgi:tRNA 2-thiouridine synthesizing protein A